MENIIEVEDKDQMADMNIMVKWKMADQGHKVMMNGDFKMGAI